MKCAFQLVKQVDGSRSEPFVFSRDEFAELLFKNHTVEDCDAFYVLVLCEFPTRVTDNPEWDFSMAPLMTIRRYVEVFGNGRLFPEQPDLSVSSDADIGAGE